jgi:hypothetical protein
MNLKNMLFKKLLYIVSVLSVAVTIVAGATLPNIVNWYLSNISNAGLDMGGGVKVFLYITYIPFLLILISVMRLSGKLLKGSPFCKESIRELKMMVFIISSVVRELINNGIELQEENDLTI